MNELGNTPADKNYKPSGISKAEQAAGKIHNRALLEAEKYAASHAGSIVEEVAYGRGFKAGFIEGYEQAEKDLGWISVKDRLPDTTEYVFTCIKMDGKPQCVGFHYYKDGKWWEGYEEDSVGAVEYWMQIPQFKKAKQ